MHIDGFSTPRVDVTDPAFQADSAYKPDKVELWANLPESNDGWVHAHNAVRFELGEFKRVIIQLGEKALDDWEVQAVKAWWAGHEKHIHEHHSNEDDIFNPKIRERVVYPEKLEADHVQLVECMEAIAAAVLKLKAGDSLATDMQPLWERYETFMLPHLHEEEQVGLPLARAYFTPAEIEKLVGQILKGSDPISLGSFVHVLGHKADAQQFMRENGIPSFVWFLPGKGFKALRTLYRVKMQSHIDSLLAGQPVSARTKKDAKENAALSAKAYGGSERVSAQSALSPCKRANVNSAAHPRSF